MINETPNKNRVTHGSFCAANCNRLLAAVFVLTMYIIVTMVPAPSYAGTYDYRLGAGDRISITVFDEEDLSIEARLGDSATISYPLLGKIQIKNMTVRDLEHHITSRLSGDYLVKPRVSVSIIEYRKFFVKGEVKNPGGYSYSPDLTMDKVISLAGGFTNRADKGKILIQSEQNGNKQSRTSNLDTMIMPGDVITVERRFF